MGWASGSIIAEELWDAIRESLPAGIVRRAFAQKFIDVFRNYDCDTIEEAENLMNDAYDPCPGCSGWLQFEGETMCQYKEPCPAEWEDEDA